jgi:hypothetical protein
MRLFVGGQQRLSMTKVTWMNEFID